MTGSIVGRVAKLEAASRRVDLIVVFRNLGESEDQAPRPRFPPLAPPGGLNVMPTPALAFCLAPGTELPNLKSRRE
jgi:hypothetical protein